MDKYDNMLDITLSGGDKTALIKNASERMCALAERYGKALSPANVNELYRTRATLLQEAGRIELGVGVLPQIAYALCDSPFIARDEFTMALTAFMELFYSYKNDCEGELSDDELIDALAGYFNACEGDWQQTADAGFGEIMRIMRR